MNNYVRTDVLQTQDYGTCSPGPKGLATVKVMVDIIILGLSTDKSYQLTRFDHKGLANFMLANNYFFCRKFRNFKPHSNIPPYST